MNEIRVVLVGATGSGKSSLGNTLLGREEFRTEGGLASSTGKCSWAEGSVDGVKFSVTDTPGLCDTNGFEEEVLVEVAKSVSVACPGPHVVILTLRCDLRFTQEDYATAKILLELFGNNIREHLMVVFNGGNRLDGDMQQKLQQVLRCKASKNLKEVLSDACDRYCVVDNTGSCEERQPHAKIVLTKVQDLMKRNNGAHFTNPMINAFNEKVQEFIAYHQMGNHLTQDEAFRTFRRQIVDEKKVSTILSTLKDIAKTYMLPMAISIATTLAMKKCSVM